MTNINRVILVGNIVRDCGSGEREFGYTQGGMAIARISIAVNSSKKSGNDWVDEVSYFDVNIWGKTAENLKPYLKKGQKVAIDGRLKQERWQDQSGSNKSKIVINAESVELCSGKKEEGFTPEKTYSTAQAAREADNSYTEQSAYAKQYEAQQNELGIDEDIPF